MKQRIAHPVGLPSPSAYAHIVNATGGGASMCMPSRSMGSVRRRTRGGGELSVHPWPQWFQDSLTRRSGCV